MNSEVSKIVLLVSWLGLSFLRILECHHEKILQLMQESIPENAMDLPQAELWNAELNWTKTEQWNLENSKCWGAGYVRRYYNKTINRKWDNCRITSAFGNLNLPVNKQYFGSGTCCYIQCALHWDGWWNVRRSGESTSAVDYLQVNDDWSYNEARGENMAKDSFGKSLPLAMFSALMKGYRDCKKLYKEPLNHDCKNNIEFAKCHVHVLSKVCEMKIEAREPLPPELIPTTTVESLAVDGSFEGMPSEVSNSDTKKNATGFTGFSAQRGKSPKDIHDRVLDLSEDEKKYVCENYCRLNCSAVH